MTTPPRHAGTTRGMLADQRSDQQQSRTAARYNANSESLSSSPRGKKSFWEKAWREVRKISILDVLTVVMGAGMLCDVGFSGGLTVAAVIHTRASIALVQAAKRVRNGEVLKLLSGSATTGNKIDYD